MTETTPGDPPDTQALSPGAATSTPEGTVLCEVFRSPRREGMYLYVQRSDGLTQVPESLLERFGSPQSALVFRLHGQRRLARASATEVLNALVERGFYLQMPPGPGREDTGAADPGAAGAQAGAPPAPAVTPVDPEEPPC